MSQGDYIKLKKVATQIKNQGFSPVLSSQNYTEYAAYTMKKDIVNTKPILNQLTLSGNQIVNDMERKMTNCSVFTMCKNTNTRGNRVALIGPYITPKPLRPLMR